MTGLLHEYVADQAECRGDAIALVMGTVRLTFGELELASNRLAHLLAQAGCGHRDRICLFASKSPAAIVGMLATLKIGAAYVPIDIASPAARTARIVRSAEPSAVLAAHSAAALLEELGAAGALSPDLPAGALDAAPDQRLRLEVAFGPEEAAAQAPGPLPTVGAPDDAAHILFTSGSTGDPKGVVITHANVTAFVHWATSYFGTRPDHRISGHPPLHLDLSTFDIYATFRCGAELHLVPPLLLPRQLADFISAAQLTQWFSVPSTFTYMAKSEAEPEEGFPSLERVLWCGEVLPTPVLVHWVRRVRQASFTNLYDPTEATIASSYDTIPDVPRDETEPIPIGSACARRYI